MDDERSKILQGTLDLMVLKTLDAMGPMHGYGIALRIEQVAGNTLTVHQGTLYVCLVRLLQRKWLSATWATSENNRRARFYTLTAAGRRQLQAETANWDRVAGVMGRLLQLGKA
jgi:PadR family transcriptional regulator, regulatory protein PadR